jgi:DNA-binding transcriptional LysR family regulator
MHPSVHAKVHYFLAVAETLNFRAAARKLGIAQPALSRSIRQLEQHFGFALFERSTRHVAMTEAGQVLFRDGALALRQLDRACEHAGQVAQGLRGTLRIGYSTFAATGPMSDIIIAFRSQYPEAQVSLRLLASSEQAAAFDAGALDLGFMMSNVSAAPLQTLPISSEPLIAVVPLAGNWSKRRSITLKQLSAAPIVIGTASRWRGFRGLIDEIADTDGVTLNIVEDADDLPVLLQLVRSGFGSTILDASFIPTLPPGVRPLQLDGVVATLDISLAWRSDSMSPLVPRFVEVAERLKRKPGRTRRNDRE